MTLHLPPFDPSRIFMCRGKFRAGGKWWSKGEIFDKSFVNDRVLRQLYDARKVTYATNDELDQSQAKERAAGFAGLLDAFVGTVVSAGRSLLGVQQPEDRNTRITRLVNRCTRDQLVELADGLDYPEGATKAVIAAALVDAGRDGTT